jgi:hypothetical protein
MCRSREFRFIVHDCDGFGFLPVQVVLVLNADCDGASAYVGKDGTFHSPPAWFFLPVPL